ncbi:MBG domain-containing protein [Pedobacter duraquae]|uniref:Gliding motility-associated-like protein n=1 Tax=Pedobacter duraquae TaxID=425511 RepID=A0A4R6IBT3_9SPHI|nr:MBG domain-containing protein [Pedobacter duraquae]TDO19066.1 gliding motility-associated-like protein [Pedobacter duraquae]
MNKFYKSRFNLRVVLLFLLMLSQTSLLKAQDCAATVVSKTGLKNNAVSGIAYGNSAYVAVGINGSILNSADGKIWSQIKTDAFLATEYTRVIYGADKFVAIGSGGKIATSPDGTNWTIRTSGTTNPLVSIAYGNGKYIALAGGGVAISSPDGVSWTTIATGMSTNADDYVKDVAYGNNTFVIGQQIRATNLSVAYSSASGNANTWTRTTIFNATDLNNLVFINDKFWTFNAGNKIYTSSNGATWTALTGTVLTGTGAQVFAGYYDGSKYYFFGSGGSPINGYTAIFNSTNGNSWTMEQTKKHGLVPRGAGYFNNKGYLLTDEGISYTENGTDWSYLGLNIAGVVKNGMTYVAVGGVGSDYGGTGIISTSTDFNTWTGRSASGAKNLNGIVYAQNKYVAVGNLGTLATSTDAVTWTTGTTVANFNGTAIAASPTVFVAVGEDGIVSSTDGLTWTRRLTDANFNFRNVKYLNNRFVAVGYKDLSSYPDTHGFVKTSTDGINWTDITPQLNFVVAGFSGVVWTGSKYVLAGIEAVNAANYDFNFFSVNTTNIAVTTGYTGKKIAAGNVHFYDAYYDGDITYQNGAYIVGQTDNGNYLPVTLTTGDNSTAWTVNAMADADGFIKAWLPEGTDFKGLGYKNTKFVVTPSCMVAAPDVTKPTVAITTTAVSPVLATTTIPVTVTFSESVTGFTAAKVNVANGGISGFAGSGASYTFNVTPTAAGAVTVNIAAAAAADAAGNTSEAATQLSVTAFTPTITTVAATNIAVTSATLSGNLVSATGATITERGIVYGTALNPTITNTKVGVGTTDGPFSASVTALTTNTVYHFRAYVTYGTTTIYGDDLTVTPAAVNNAPVITSTGITAAVENVPYSYAITATDADTDPLTITATTLPSWLTIAQGASTGTAIGTPTNGGSGVAVDAQGNLYIVTSNQIYKITPAGVKTLWATKTSGITYNLAINGNYLYIGYYGSCGSLIKRMKLDDPAAGEEVVVNNANLSGGMGMTFRDGYMYFSAYSCRSIGRLNLTTLQSSVFASGLPNAGPWGLDFAENGDLYVAMMYTNTLIKFAAGTTTNPTTLLSGLPGAPSDVKIDKNGYVYVSFYGGSVGVRRYTKDLSSFITVGSGDVLGMALSAQGTLSYATYSIGQAYKLETGAVLSGTPTHANVGDHPVVINVTDGKANVQQAFTITVTDPNPPTVTAYSPLNNAIDVPLAQNLVLTFNETVVKGTGNIVIKNVANDAVVETIDVTSNKVTITNNNIVTIDPAADLAASGNYYITIDAGALKDASANNYAGITAKTAFTFKTILNQSPVFSSTAVTAVNENVAYSYTVTATDADSDPLTYTATTLPSWLTLTQTGNVVTLTGTPLHANVGNNSVVLNVSDGKANVTQSFTIAVADVTAPTVTAFAPLNNAVDVALAQNIVLTFSEDVVKGTGNITIKKVADDAVVETISVTSAQVTIATNVVTIDPAANLVAGNQYYVTVDATAIKDPSANEYAGISNKTTLAFRTIKAASVITFAAQSATYGAADFTPVYSSTNTATTVTFTSADDNVATIVDNKVHIIKAGTVSITASQAGDLSYNAATPVTQTLTINALPVTVTAQAATKVYGAAEPALTYAVSAPLKGTDALTGALSRVAGTGIGAYDITIGTLANANYALTLVSAKVTVTAKPIEVTANAGLTKVYAAAEPTIGYALSTGNTLVGGDQITGAPGRATGETVGDYAVNIGTLTAGANYTLTIAPATFSITAKPITVTANAGQTKVYLAADPALTYTAAPGSLKTGDGFTGALQRATGENVGTTYAINQGTLSAGTNYAITFVPANFAITPKAVTVTATAGQTKVFNTTDPVFAYTPDAALATGNTFTGALARAAGEDVNVYAINQGTLSAGSNYSINFVGADFSISAKPITVTATAGQSKVYLGTEPTLAYTTPAGSLKTGDFFTGALARAAGEAVNTYAINQGTLTAGSNYTITFTGANFAITPKTVTVTATAGQSKVYGAADPVFAYTPDAPLATGNTFTGTLARAAGEGVGTNYAINVGTLSAGANYSISFVPANFAITAKPITVTATAGQRKVYGSVDPAFAYTTPAGSLVGTDGFTGALTRAAGEHVGTAYAINQGTLTAGNNYTISFVPADFAITAKPIAVAATAGQSKVYGDADPVFAYTAPAGSLVNNDTFSGALTRATGENVGAAYAINQGTLTAGSDYTITYTGANFAITAKPITVAATAGQTKVYGEADPVFAYGITSGTLVGNDQFTGLLTRAAGENIGTTYPINQGTLTAGSNYTLTYTPANFSITNRAITVVADAGQTKVYGTADPVFTYSITAGNLAGNDKLTGALTRDAGEDIGAAYAITQGTLTAGSNYTITYRPRDFSITAKPITVTANAGQTKVYGATDPALTYAITSGALVGSDKITGTLSRADGENIGTTYAINQNTLTAGNNYTLTYVGDNFSITAKPIVVAATAGQTKIYGTADPVFAFTASTLVGADVFTGALSRAAGENIGNAYAINQGTLTAGSNYTITYTGANFSITPKAVAATAVAKTKVYGEGDPALTYTFAPALVNGDSFTGALSRVSGEAVNTYAINQGTLALNNNYALTFAPSALTITKKGLVITADNKEKFAGTANPELTVSFAGFVNNETRSVLTTQPAITTTATTASPIGTYTITATGAAAANYSISYINGTLTVKPAAPTSVALAGVTVFENSAAGTNAGTLSSTSDDPAATFTYSLVNGSGDTDNNLFKIVGTSLQTTAALDYESKANYSVRVRSTTQYGFSLDQVFTVALTDVNEIPTIAAIANQTICYTTNAQSVALTGVTAGQEASQTVALTVSSTNAGLFDALTVAKGNGTAGTLTYRVKNGVTGTATVTVTVRDNGGVENGGVDVTTRTFTITVNALPVVAISSDKGLSISKGVTAVLTATGGVSYSWRNMAGVISGQNTASLTIRPDVTATYEVTATNASGCSEVQTITIEVLSDYIAVKATNIMSPNGDGKNDFFIIENIDKYPNNELKVFDRAGRIIYGKKGYDNTFDATIKGSPLKEGTYYYIIDFGPNQLKKKGFITVIRDN